MIDKMNRLRLVSNPYRRLISAPIVRRASTPEQAHVFSALEYANWRKKERKMTKMTREDERRRRTKKHQLLRLFDFRP